MPKICIRAPEIVMSGDFSMQAQLSVSTKVNWVLKIFRELESLYNLRILGVVLKRNDAFLQKLTKVMN